MRSTIWKSVVAALLGTLLLAAPAFAADPAQDAYGASSSGSLPFTGINLVAILAVAIALLTVGVVVRVRASRSH